MAYIDAPLRTIQFHGPIVKYFGREFTYRALTLPKVIDAMKNLLPGFERYMLEAHKRGLAFSIFMGKRNVGQDELDLTKGTEDIHLLQVGIGSKRAGMFQLFFGAALIGAAMLTGPAEWSAFGASGTFGGALAMAGASMVLGRVCQMLSPQIGGLRTRQDQYTTPSYVFGGPVNTTAQGHPVGVLYGTREISGAVISAGIYTEDQQ